MSKSKGNRIVRERAVPFYESLGFLVDKVEKVGRYQMTKDLYSKALGENYNDSGFDLVCIKKDLVVLVQVKTNSPATREWYHKFADLFAGKHLQIHCFTWYDKEGIRLQLYEKNGILKEIELRKSRNEDAKRVIWFDPDYIRGHDNYTEV